MLFVINNSFVLSVYNQALSILCHLCLSSIDNSCFACIQQTEINVKYQQIDIVMGQKM
jgi:hypothetical protein